MPKLHIVVPTVKGREQSLARCLHAYFETLTEGVGFIKEALPPTDWLASGFLAAPDPVNHFIHHSADPSFVIHTYRDPLTCGEGWAAGAKLFDLDDEAQYLHFTADDLKPGPGWFQPLIDCVDSGSLPAPEVINPDGSRQSLGGKDFTVNTNDIPPGTEVDFTPVPFMNRYQWDLIEPMPPLHYCSDVWVSFRARRKAGIKTVVVPTSKFVHYNEMPGRGAGMDPGWRPQADRLLFEQYLREIP